jgi:hypothetical protein
MQLDFGRVASVVLISTCAANVPGLGSAEAARQPTFKEREGLTLALPAWLRRYPVGCVWLKMLVSNNGAYAIVAPAFLNATRAPCLRYASNGYWILKRVTRWKIIFSGSELPPCSMIIPRDLTRCRR